MQSLFNFLVLTLPLWSLSNAIICQNTTLAIYTLTLHTFWNAKDFPKQFPLFRPPAQWSKLFGITHNDKTILWREGKLANPGVMQLAKKGKTEILEEEVNNGTLNVYNHFLGSSITKGEGKIYLKFFADGHHSKISVISKIIPSPDWFIGLDSYNLCQDNHWLESAEVKVDPMDAGIDDGFTFTSPKWESEPKQKISRITSKYPDHPVNSFYYPEMENLPNIAKLIIKKEKIYKLIEEDEKKGITGNTTELGKPYYVKNLKKKNIKQLPHFNFRIVQNILAKCTSFNSNKWSRCKQCDKLATAINYRKAVRIAMKCRKFCCDNEQNNILKSGEKIYS